MNKFVQIRNIPEALHRKLKMRAAQKDMSITDYVKKLIEHDIEKPTLAEMAARLKKLPPVRTSESSAEIVRQLRDEH